MIRQVAIVVVALATVFAGGVVGTRAQVEAEPCIASTDAIGDLTAEGIRFSGEAGQQITESFDLPSGTVIYRFEMSGLEGNNIVSLVEAPGSEGRSFFGGIANEIGPTTGAGTTDIEAAGAFLLDVNASGPWSVSFEF